MDWVSSLARRVRRAASEMNHSSMMASALLLSYGTPETDRAPDTYAEFLFRARAVYRREPTACCRAQGRPVR